MGKKGGKFKKNEKSGLVKKNGVDFDSKGDDMMNDEIDKFHKERDVIPLNVNDDTEDSDEENEEPMLDFKDDDDDESGDDFMPAKGLEAKIVRTQKFLRDKFGGLEEETPDDTDDEESDPKFWNRPSDLHHKPQSSDEEGDDLEESEAMRVQIERAKTFSMEDYGFEDASQNKREQEPTFEEILDSGKFTAEASHHKNIQEDAAGITYETVKKDLNTLTKEEQMEVVYSSAPELVGLLSELRDALRQLEENVNPVVDKINRRESIEKRGLDYLQVKQLLLQSYCQAITFYLLLKTEGHSIRDHPVLSRLVEIKILMNKMTEMDENISFDWANILKIEESDSSVVKSVKETAALKSDALINSQLVSRGSFDKHVIPEPNEAAGLDTLRSVKSNKVHSKPQDTTEMLKVRAALEEKIKQKGIFGSSAPKNIGIRANQKPVNRQLETLDDFDDAAMEVDGIAQKLALHPNQRKRKVISGDDDLPKRDDIGERRRKYEQRVLAGAGIKSYDGVENDDIISSDEGGADTNDDETGLELYKQHERERATKIAAKSNKYSRTPGNSSLPDDTTVDGKRNITRQIEKNRGLTRARKKETKNPRKKYKLKHKKAEVSRKGQVRAIIKPTDQYGGEKSGINDSISRSRRF